MCCHFIKYILVCFCNNVNQNQVKSDFVKSLALQSPILTKFWKKFWGELPVWDWNPIRLSVFRALIWLFHLFSFKVYFCVLFFKQRQLDFNFGVQSGKIWVPIPCSTSVLLMMGLTLPLSPVQHLVQLQVPGSGWLQGMKISPSSLSDSLAVLIIN